MNSNEMIIGKVRSVTNEYVEVIYSDKIHTFSPIISGKTVRIGQIGTWVKIDQGMQMIIGEISSVLIEPYMKLDEDGNQKEFEIKTCKIKLIGELSADLGFVRGVVHYPSISDEVKILSKTEWDLIYPNDPDALPIGFLVSASHKIARIQLQDVVSRHFLIAGMTGSGKSNFCAVLIKEIIKTMNTPHLILFDVHGEYKTTLGEEEGIQYITALKNPNTFTFPAWLLNFKELKNIFHLDLDQNNSKKIIHKLKLNHYQTILESKPENIDLFPDFDSINCRSNIPFDFNQFLKEIEFCSKSIVTKNHKSIEFIEDDGRINLEKENFFCFDDDSIKIANKTIENVKFLPIEESSGFIHKYRDDFQQIRLNLKDIMENPRFKFLFPSLDSYSLKEWYDDLTKLFQKKVSIIDLSELPKSLKMSIIRVILTKLKQIYSHNVNQKLSSLFVLIEESHQFSSIPEISEIMREGRKFGLGIGLISQRPAKISDDCLSQIGTYSVFRITNAEDINKMTQILPDNFSSSIPKLPLLKTGEMILMGDGSPTPQHVNVIYDRLKKEGSDANLNLEWNRENYDEDIASLKKILKKIRMS